MAVALFLEMNGWKFNPPEEEAVLQTLALAAGKIDADEFSAWLQASCVATKPYCAARTSWMISCKVVRPRKLFRSIVNAMSHGGSGSGCSPPPKNTASCSW